MEKVKKKVGIANTGAFVMAFLSVTKACWAEKNHWKASFLSKSVKGFAKRLCYYAIVEDEFL